MFSDIGRTIGVIATFSFSALFAKSLKYSFTAESRLNKLSLNLNRFIFCEELLAAWIRDWYFCASLSNAALSDASLSAISSLDAEVVFSGVILSFNPSFHLEKTVEFDVISLSLAWAPIAIWVAKLAGIVELIEISFTKLPSVLPWGSKPTLNLVVLIYQN